MAKTKMTVGCSAKPVKVWTELTEKVTKRHGLLVEDMVDSGRTVKYLVAPLRKQKPASIAVCALLSRQANRRVEIALQYVGFEIPATYVVGYGLDFQQKYRNLLYLAKLDTKLADQP